MEEIKKEIVNIVTTYKAVDGTIFKTKEDCENYEAKLNNKSNIDKLNALEIKELRGVLPLRVNEDVYNDSAMHWYNISTEEELELLEYVYPPKYDADISAPNIICVEFPNEPEYNIKYYTLGRMMQEALWLLSQFSYGDVIKCQRDTDTEELPSWLVEKCYRERERLYNKQDAEGYCYAGCFGGSYENVPDDLLDKMAAEYENYYDSDYSPNQLWEGVFSKFKDALEPYKIK